MPTNRPECERTGAIDSVNVGAGYSDEQLEFLKEVERYKKVHRKKFLSCTEVLEVVKSMGYVKQEKSS